MSAIPKGLCQCGCGGHTRGDPQRGIVAGEVRRYMHGHHGRRFISGPSGPNWRDGRCRHPLYHTYNNMLGRCYDPKHVGFRYWGGRGISVCQRWRESFWDFVSDMGKRPPRTWLDRIDNDGNYEPGNCRWADYSTSNRNKRQPRRDALGRFM